MKNTIKWIVIAILLVGIIAGSLFLYNKYSEEYGMNNPIHNEDKTTEETPDVQENDNSAPDFTVTDYDGNKVNLSDFKGKPVVVNFWATWCYYCTVEMPDFNEAYKENPDVQFLMVNATGINGETVESAKAYVLQEKYEFDVFFDTEFNAIRTYGITSYPQTIFIDKDGNIVSRRIGMLSKDSLIQEIKKITE